MSRKKKKRFPAHVKFNFLVRRHQKAREYYDHPILAPPREAIRKSPTPEGEPYHDRPYSAHAIKILKQTKAISRTE